MMLGSTLADHHSRIACATGDATGFKEVINKLTEE